MLSSKVFNRRDLVTAFLLGIFIAFFCVMSGPETIDSMDGPEFAVAGYRMEIPHSPGYPLFMWLLRLSGAGNYNSLRTFGCLIAGLAACGVYFAVRSFRIASLASASATLLLLSSGAVMSQLNILEVHGLSLLLASLAILSRDTRLGPYMMSLSIFGGHPLSLFLLPIVINRKWFKTWPLALIPVTMWLYVPIRSHTALVMHYGAPTSLDAVIQYFSMYAGKISGISFSGFWEILLLMGPVTIFVFLLTGFFGKIDKKLIITLTGLLLVFLFYGIPDLFAYSWLFFLPLTILAASGLERLLEKRKMLVSVLMLILLLSSVVSGLYLSWDRRDDSTQIIASDMLRGIPFNRVFCTVDGPSYYSAYLIEVEDRRPDLLAIDRYGLIFTYSLLNGPLPVIPSELAGRNVYATGAWGDLPPAGLLFSSEAGRLPWEKYEVFFMDIEPTESIARDIMAELWVLRGLQEDSHAATIFALQKAEEFAESEGAIRAVASISDNLMEMESQ